MGDPNGLLITVATGVVTLMVAIIGYFVARIIGRVETSRDDLSSVRETIGQMKAVNEAQWRKLDHAEKQILELTKTVEVLKDRSNAKDYSTRKGA